MTRSDNFSIAFTVDVVVDRGRNRKKKNMTNRVVVLLLLLLLLLVLLLLQGVFLLCRAGGPAEDDAR
jgi:hypothetical protein